MKVPHLLQKDSVKIADYQQTTLNSEEIESKKFKMGIKLVCDPCKKSNCQS